MTQSDAQVNASLDNNERVETLLIELSARFINLPSEQVGREIEDAQRRICECLGLDRSALWQQHAEDPDTLRLTHVYQRPDMRQPAMSADARTLVPWLLAQIQRGRMIAISKLDDLPLEAARDREALRRYGTNSTVVIPLVTGGAVFGTLTFASARERKGWPEGLVKRLQLVAEVFANAITRDRSDQALRESRERYALAVEGANDGLWDWDIPTDKVYFSPRWKGMLGYEDHEVANTFSAWEKLLHPEDRDRAVAALRDHLAGQIPAYELEHRLRGKDNGYRWVLARGKVLRDSEGRPYRMAGSHTDITQRKQAEENLRQRNQYIETVLEQAPIGFAVHTIDDRVGRFVSARFEEIYGVPRGTITSHDDFFDTVWPNDLVFREQIRRRVLADIASRDPSRMRWENVPVVLASGETRYITATNIPLFEQNLMVSTVQDVTERVRAEEKLRQAYDEVKQLRDQLQQENIYLRGEMEDLHGHGRIVGQSRTLKHVLAQAEQVAPTDSTVLLLGETGTGKELIASAIHDLSPRRGRTMVRVNCAAIPASLLESELFGREKGAYTGALSRQVGRFEMANGSTLFLDEIGDLPPEVQAKLLRVLQERQIERLGSSKTLDVDVRIITATNRDLERAVREGEFREDLYYRLNVFPITVPPLRERRDDIAVLVSAFVEEFATRFGKSIESIDKKSMESLQRYHWPGNVRELRNVIERAMIVAKGPKLWIEPPGGTVSASTRSLSMRDTEHQHIRQVLDMTGWRVRGKNGAAEILGLKPSTLESRMVRLGIRRDKNPTK